MHPFQVLLLICLFPTSYSTKQIVTEEAYPINGVCKEKHYNISDHKTCLNLMETNSEFEISYYNSTSSECCLSNYQYIFATKKSDNCDFTSFRIDFNDTCPLVEKPWALETMNGNGKEKFVMTYNDTTQIMNITNPNCNGSLAIINGTRYCYIFLWTTGGLSRVGFDPYFQGKQYIASNPFDLHWARIKFQNNLRRDNKTLGMLIMDGKRTENCQRADKIGLPECKFPNGFDFVDKENPMLNSYTFVDNPSISTDKLCVSMFLNLNDPNVNMKVDYVKCNYYWEGDYWGRMTTAYIPNDVQIPLAPTPPLDIQSDF